MRGLRVTLMILSIGAFLLAFGVTLVKPWSTFTIVLILVISAIYASVAILYIIKSRW